MVSVEEALRFYLEKRLNIQPGHRKEENYLNGKFDWLFSQIHCPVWSKSLSNYLFDAAFQVVFLNSFIEI